MAVTNIMSMVMATVIPILASHCKTYNKSQLLSWLMREEINGVHCNCKTTKCSHTKIQ